MLVEKQFKFTIINFYNDNGGEYLALCAYLNLNGISWLTIAPHTPKQNGTSERRHCYILETGKVVLHHSGLPTYLSHAFQMEIYLINHMHTITLQGRSPLDALFHRLPNIRKL